MSYYVFGKFKKGILNCECCQDDIDNARVLRIEILCYWEILERVDLVVNFHRVQDETIEDKIKHLVYAIIKTDPENY